MRYNRRLTSVCLACAANKLSTAETRPRRDVAQILFNINLVDLFRLNEAQRLLAINLRAQEEIEQVGVDMLILFS